MKSYGVTIQIKPLQQYFHVELFIPSYFTKENLIIYAANFNWAEDKFG